MRCLFDTSAHFAPLNHISPPLRERPRHLVPADVGLPEPVACELCHGACKIRHADRSPGLLDRLEFEIVPFDDGYWRRQPTTSRATRVARATLGSDSV